VKGFLVVPLLALAAALGMIIGSSCNVEVDDRLHLFAMLLTLIRLGRALRHWSGHRSKLIGLHYHPQQQGCCRLDLILGHEDVKVMLDQHLLGRDMIAPNTQKSLIGLDSSKLGHEAPERFLGFVLRILGHPVGVSVKIVLVETIELQDAAVFFKFREGGAFNEGNALFVVLVGKDFRPVTSIREFERGVNEFGVGISFQPFGMSCKRKYIMSKMKPFATASHKLLLLFTYQCFIDMWCKSP
jgi:hypothetical protein